MPAGCAATTEKLQKRGFRVHPVELDEFLKAGGAAKCLSLRLDRT
jgi:N-dimethylarginine dimethylaminohydrolase